MQEGDEPRATAPKKSIVDLIREPVSQGQIDEWQRDFESTHHIIKDFEEKSRPRPAPPAPTSPERSPREATDLRQRLFQKINDVNWEARDLEKEDPAKALLYREKGYLISAGIELGWITLGELSVRAIGGRGEWHIRPCQLWEEALQELLAAAHIFCPECGHGLALSPHSSENGTTKPLNLGGNHELR